MSKLTFVFVVLLVIGAGIGLQATLAIDRVWIRLMVAVLAIFFITFAFDKSRERATWAKVMIVVVGVLILMYSITFLLIDSHMLEVPPRLRAVYWPVRKAAAWAIAGLLFALVFSGQLLGRKAQT